MSKHLKQLNQKLDSRKLLIVLLGILLGTICLVVGLHLGSHVAEPVAVPPTRTIDFGPVVVEEPKRSETWDRLSVADIVEDVRGAVVHISKIGECQGSGAIISPDGIIFTAKHVTDGTFADYNVTLDDGRVFKVKYVFEDNDNDVAFMQLDLPKGHEALPYVNLAEHDLMRVGDPLLIYGSPLGEENINTVSQGILSAATRDLVEMSDGARECVTYDWYVLFQSTSPAYPGNSGGPVFNLNGEVIGVLVAGMRASINYSVPVARFRDTIDVVRQGLALQRFSPVTKESTRLAQLERQVYLNEICLQIVFEILTETVDEDIIWEATVEVLQNNPGVYLYDISTALAIYSDPTTGPPPPITKNIANIEGGHPTGGVGQYKVRE